MTALIIDSLNKQRLKLSLVVPVYNCEDCIYTSISRLKRVVDDNIDDYEIIVVDDGSIDDTPNILKNNLKDRSIRIISYNKNKGKGYAIKQGVSLARGSKIIFIDGDLDIDASILSHYIKALDEHDIVIASKYHEDSIVNVSFSRRLLSKVFNMLVKALLGVKVSDTQVGLKGGKAYVFKEIFKRLTIDRYAFDVELLALAKMLGYDIFEMPIILRIDKRFSIIEAARMLLDLIRIFIRLRVKHEHTLVQLEGY